MGYNVDSFGHNGSLPKILKNSGMDSYVFMRPSPNEKELPQSVFMWESADGSKVCTYRIPFFYNLDILRMNKFFEIEEMEKQKGHDMMAFYGVGNHGGGPTIELLDKMHSELGEEFVYSSPEKYFATIDKKSLPVVKDDLQYHARGCYSVNAKVKKQNRKAQKDVVDFERYSALSKVLMNTRYPEEEINRAWNDILFNQFHDILGGCCIKDVYESASYSYGESLAIAERGTNFALQQISWNIDTMDGKEFKPYRPPCGAGFEKSPWQSEELIGTPIVVFNPLSFAVKKTVNTNYMPIRIEDSDGNAVAIQRVRCPRTNSYDKYEMAFLADIPAFGYSVYRMYFESKPEIVLDNPFVCTDCSLENEFVKLVFNEKTGELVSFFDKKKNCELLSGETYTVLLDETDSDTWSHDIAKFDRITDRAEKGSVCCIEQGPVRAVIRSKIKIGNSTVMRDYILESDSGVVKVKTKVDFHEHHKMLKFKIPVNCENARAYAKIPFGYIERPTDATEQVCGEWVALKDEQRGILLMNDSKHGFDADKNVLSLTVLRGAIYADHFGERDEFCEYMDQGEHEFSYALANFVSFSDSERKAQEFSMQPYVVNETFHHGNLPLKSSNISISKENIIVTAIKKHEDSDAWILRCYESENKDTETEIELFGIKFSAKFSHSEVKTFIVADDNVSECDFIEWKK